MATRSMAEIAISPTMRTFRAREWRRELLDRPASARAPARFVRESERAGTRLNPTAATIDVANANPKTPQSTATSSRRGRLAWAKRGRTAIAN
ncbi:MAG: hypothetical protein HC767_07060 [Akkermansiaceae bacterium]|nr:hypothetical protein [Akkermansiaceae bacterium]